MNALKGTWRLFLLQLRLDRVKVPLWVTITIGIIYVTLDQLKLAYDSTEQVLLYASTTAPSIVTRLLGGALTGPSIGEITIIESFLLIALLVCLVNIFLVVRHTRKNEEEGRSEIISSLIVGRQAGLTSTLLFAFLLNTLFTVGLIAVYTMNHFPLEGTLLYSIATGLMGMFFASVAAVTAQLFENSRSASGVAALIFTVSFLLRGLGDAFGTLRESGLGVESGFLSYLSPLGWVTNTKPFSGDEQPWLLGLIVGGIVLLIIGAYVLSARRDVAGSTFTSQPGKSHAPSYLLKRVGLVWRLHRTAFISWLGAMVIMGTMIGAVADEFDELIAGNDQMRELLAAIGGGTPTDIMFSATFAISGLALAGYGLQILTRMQSEEGSGRTELLLSTPLSRFSWILQYILFATVSTLFILCATGLSAGLAYGIIVGDIWHHTVSLSMAIMVHAPAILVILGFAVLLFGLAPRFYVPLVWSMLTLCLLIYQLGTLLDLPEWIMNLSPFTHTPAVPSDAITFTPLWIMSAVAVGLCIVGMAVYRQRNLTTT